MAEQFDPHVLGRRGMSRARSGATSALRLLAADLRARRVASGVSIAVAAEKLDVHPTTIRRLEAAKHTFKPATVAHLLRVYGAAEPEVEDVLARLADANTPGWWHEYRDLLTAEQAERLDFESSASLIRGYAPGLVPDLLQTGDYTRALLAAQYPGEDRDRLGRRAELADRRKREAFDRERPLRYWCLIEHAALHRVVGGPEVMRGQLDHLNAIAADAASHIKVQVMPLTTQPHPMLASGAVEIVRFDHRYLADRLVVRGLHQSAATITDDIDAVRAFNRAMDSACLAAPRPTTAIPSPLTRGGER
ncbi:helix-turn-helix domain-containing protein [Streptomyces marincola]|uniref:helix-turn-helix domain-containing protein n=1 Tax=Streptomyces marincola TaxID=2878388 RepID=UPI001CF31ABB|nr:helix-turn-helix transcriptional regulator [Streptomyces marincola]UCM91095.1 helix-turn-helix domain-containing protein [Streptomyces marincola]